MKNYIIILFVALCAIVACKKTEISTTETSTTEAALPVFTNSFVVNDGKGNSANVTVSGANESQILGYSAAQFDIVVTEATPLGINSSEPKQDDGKVRFADWTEENTVTISVTSFSLEKNVKGFRVDLKPEFKNSIERWHGTFYRYDVEGVSGAAATYLWEDCSGEELDLDLDKKQACSNWFWQDLSNGYLVSPGQSWSFTTTSRYCRWRFRYEFEDNCGGSSGIDWFWWL